MEANGIEVTIFDVAREAGVSKSTVARVLSKHGYYSRETMGKVMKAVEKLNYHPNGIARAMKTRKTGNIAIVMIQKHMPALVQPFYSAILSSVVETATKYNYGIFLYSDNDVQNSIDHLRERRVDGVILGSSITSSILEQLRSQNVPVVMVNHSIEAPGTSYVLSDDYGGATSAVEYLLELGHKRIGMLSGPLTHRSFKLRVQAYQDALRKRGLVLDPRLIAEADSVLEGGRQAANSVMLQSPRPTALFAGNDMMALGAIKELEEHGLRVPADVAVVGFDDIEFASIYDPPLTTVHVNRQLMGEMAVGILHRQMTVPAGVDPLVEKVIIPTKLVVRSSG